MKRKLLVIGDEISAIKVYRDKFSGDFDFYSASDGKERVLTNLETVREDCMKLGASECRIKSNTSISEVEQLVKKHLP